MLFMKNDPLWHDLKSHVLKIDELLKEAHRRSITGFIEFDFSNFSAAILLMEGKLLECIKFSRNKAPYPVPESEILEDVKTEDATVGFYRLDKNILLVIHRLANSDPLFVNLDSKYTDIKKLLLTLEKDSHTGVVTMRSEEGECYLLLDRGSPGYCVCFRNDQLTDSAESLDWFLNASERTLVISVYRMRETPDVVAELKKVVTTIMGKNAEKIERMLEDSGRSKEDLLKTVEEIEKVTYLFFDKKKTKVLSEKLKETIEEVMP